MATYIEPKTDWQADDCLTYVDYNRIKNNLVYLNDKFNDMYPNPYTFNPGDDMTIDQMFKASKWNMFEDCVEHFQRTGKIITFGERSYYKDNGHLPDFNQLNRLEKCIEAYAQEDIPVTDFVLSDTSLELLINDTHQLSVVSWVPSDATYKTVTWTSSDTSIATVSDDGLVTAVGQGTITITATCPDGISKTCSVVVPIPVTDFTLSKSSATIEKTDTLQLSVISWVPSNATYKTVTWSSSDTSKATVDSNGLVTGTGMGDVTITATCPDGISKTCTISVKAKIISSNLITLPYDDGTSKTDYGITFTVSNDGTITANGTATGWNGRFDIYETLTLSPGSYIMGAARDINDSTTSTTAYFQITIPSQGSPSSKFKYNSRIFTLTTSKTLEYVSIYVNRDASVSNAKFYPQIYKVDI